VTADRKRNLVGAVREIPSGAPPVNQDVRAQARRKSHRLAGYDYTSPGAYFITLVTYNREWLFGDVMDEILRPNALGQIVSEEWLRSAEIRREINLDTFAVMPNHFHAVVSFAENLNVGAQSLAPLQRPENQTLARQSRSLATLVAGFKSAVTKRINEQRCTPGLPVWQRNYYDHIVRNEDELNRVREYILDNPRKWAEDPENPHSSRSLLEASLRIWG